MLRMAFKPTILAACTLAASTAAHAENWQVVTGNTAPALEVVSVDLDSIKPISRWVKAWIEDYYPNGDGPYRYQMSLEVVDCEEEQFGVLSFSRFADAQKLQVIGTPFEQPLSAMHWMHMPPGSIGAQTLEYICKHAQTP